MAKGGPNFERAQSLSEQVGDVASQSSGTEETALAGSAAPMAASASGLLPGGRDTTSRPGHRHQACQSLWESRDLGGSEPLNTEGADDDGGAGVRRAPPRPFAGGAPHEVTALLTSPPLFPGDFHFYLVHVWGGPGRAAPPHFSCPETRL